MKQPSPIILPPGVKMPKPSPPTTMKQLLDRADHEWKFKRKDEAFVLVLNALAMMSEGVAQSLNEIEHLKKKLEMYEPNDPTDKRTYPVAERSGPDSGVAPAR
jgi:hypothetical protein